MPDASGEKEGIRSTCNFKDIIQVREEHLCQLLPRIQVHRAGVWELMEGMRELKCGKLKEPRLPSGAAPQWVWEEETSLQGHLPCQEVCCQGVTEWHCVLGVTGPPGGLRPAGTLAGKAQMRTGLKEKREVKHIHVQMRNLELASPK